MEESCRRAIFLFCVAKAKRKKSPAVKKNNKRKDLEEGEITEDSTRNAGHEQRKSKRRAEAVIQVAHHGLRVFRHSLFV